MSDLQRICIVEKCGIAEKLVSDIDPGEIGQKALGLCHVPEAWTLPFFVVDRNMVLESFNNPENIKAIIGQYSKNIFKAIDKLNLGEMLIIRSSGEKEGMEERGKYESIKTQKYNLEQHIFDLLNELIKLEGDGLADVGMPLIVQKYIQSSVSGHISNERRFSKETRDFVYETQYDNGRIPLRNWRKRYDINKFENRKLAFDKNYVDMIKVVCAYYYDKKKRVHLEFVCCNNLLYIVQRDEEGRNTEAVDPSTYCIKMFEEKEKFELERIRNIQLSDKGKYQKIDNVFIYQEVGIKLPPLFILDQKACLLDLENGDIDDKLMGDLLHLTKKSLVIRTNIISDDKSVTQLSKRSNEIRSLEEAEEFLINTSNELKCKGISDYIFIFHNFIPAKIAAFVNASPLERIVEIQALWGLPEGLYYNAYDRITVDTTRIDVSSMEKDKFNITRKEMYKESFIAPNKDGKWIVKKIMAPFDWKNTIQNDNVIRDMACKARLISEKVGKELSIMWFVGIDEDYYGADNMPWYHEEYNRNSLFFASNASASKVYKKKYFNQEECIVENNEDLKRLQEASSQKIGIIRLKPKEDELLRSKDFINEIGDMCKKKGITILLEGASLAHSYYRLLATGATVLLANEIKQYDENIEFNKLVRDKIPEIIRQNGEKVIYCSIKDCGLIRALKYKLIEEAYEVFSAEKKEAILEEMADLLEVCDSIKANIKLIEKDKPSRVKVFDSKKGAYRIEFCGLIAENSKLYFYINDKMFKAASVKRNGSNLQLDLFFSKEDGTNEEGGEKRESVQFEAAKVNIIENAFAILSLNKEDMCSKMLGNISSNCNKLCKKYNCDVDIFAGIKNQKKEKRGGFEKGYVLQKTNLSSRTEEKLPGIVEYAQAPIDIYELKISHKVDVEILGTNILLVRFTFPIYYQESMSTSSPRIGEFLGANRIVVNKSFEETRFIFNVEIFKDKEVQLAFDTNPNKV